jgi:hypothetical protein
MQQQEEQKRTRFTRRGHLNKRTDILAFRMTPGQKSVIKKAATKANLYLPEWFELLIMEKLEITEEKWRRL